MHIVLQHTVSIYEFSFTMLLCNASIDPVHLMHENRPLACYSLLISSISQYFKSPIEELNTMGLQRNMFCSNFASVNLNHMFSIYPIM